MIARLKERWRELRHGEPGRRFRARYERRKCANRGAARKCLICILGAVIVLAGIVLMPLPGPGILIVAFGALLMAEGSRTVADALDSLELRVRALIARYRRPSHRRPLQRSGSR